MELKKDGPNVDDVSGYESDQTPNMFESHRKTYHFKGSKEILMNKTNKYR